MASTDVVVVGGGLIGLLTACELAERHARVVVLEKDDVGFEQSGRSVAAVNLPGGKPGSASASMLRISAEEWSTFEDRWDCVIDLNRDGWHIVIADEDDRAWLDVDRSTWQQTAGFPDSEFISAEVARQRFPQLEGEFLGLDVRHGGHVDAAMVMNALREAANRRGIRILCGSMASGFEVTRGTLVRVKTQNGSFACDAVVIAAGLWSPRICDRLGFHIPMQRIRAPAAETGPMPRNTIPGFLRAASFGARQNRNGAIRITGGYRYSAMLHDIGFGDLRDVRLWAPAFWQNRKDVSLRVDLNALRKEISSIFAQLRTGNRYIVVPRDHHPSASPRHRRRQLEALGKLIPAVGGARVQRSFAGVIDLTPDLQPVIGRVPGMNNVYVATGFSGHGYMHGPGACKAIAGVVIDGKTDIDLEPYRPERLSGRLSMRSQIF
jgi:glycine/D-amino acid oxidase-like deaminating enzyme